jgi:hypothetical protein
MRTEARPPRRLWPWITLGSVAIVAAAAVVIAFAVNGSNSSETPAAGPTTQAPQPSSTSVPDSAPTGCLGGSARDAAMLLAAQQQAQHTSNGAVELTASFVRWLYQFPQPTGEEADQVSAALFASTAAPGFTDLRAGFAAVPNSSNGVVADGVPFYRSTVPGVWHVESVEADRVTVSVGTAYVIDGALSTTFRSVSTFTLVWEDDAWKVEGGDIQRTTEEMFQIGTPFTGGC